MAGLCMYRITSPAFARIRRVQIDVINCTRLSADEARVDATKWSNSRYSLTIWRSHMIVNKEDSRAGKTGMGVRYVLGASLALAIIAIMGVYLGFI